MAGKWAAALFFFRWTQVKIDTERFVAAAEAVAQDEMVELVDVEVSPEGPRQVIRVFIDREGGARLGDCQSFSRKLGAILDVEDRDRGGGTFLLPSRLMRKANLDVTQEELFGRGTRRR